MNESEINIKRLQEAINKNKLVIFAGAGISVDSGIPDWDALIEELKSDLGIPKNETDYLKIPQYYFNERGEKEYVEKVRSILKHNTQVYNLLHEKIFELNPEHVLTTNFDNLLEQVIESNSHPYSIIKRDQDFPYSENTKYLVKVHGDLGENDFVLKENDYLNYSIKHPLIEAFLKSVFATRTVLFVGYSLNDTNLKQILHQVRNILGNNFQNAYIINNNDIANHTRNYFKSQGVNIITIKEVNTDKLDLNKKGFEKLGEKSQALFKILHKINNYDSFKIQISNVNILDLLFESIKELNDHIIYSTNDIISLKIFGDEFSLLHDFNTLYLTKDYFKYFFKELFYIKNNEIVLVEKDKITNEEKKELIKKIRFIVTKLNYNQITRIRINNDLINIQLRHGVNCECLNCLIDNLEYIKLEVEFEKRIINEGTSVIEDIQLAFAKYRIGCFHEAYDLFSNVSTKAWKRKDFIYYYIAKRNIKYLKNLIRWGVSENKFIIDDINKIDLNKLINNITDITSINSRFINNIHDERYFEYCYNLVVKEYELLTKQVISIETNTHISNYNYLDKISRIERILINVQRFYSRNYIVLDKYTDYTKLFKVSFDIYILTYKILDNLKTDKKKYIFNSRILSIFLRNLHNNDIEKSLKQYNLRNIEVEDEKFILDYLNKVIQNYENVPKGVNSFNDFKRETLFNSFLLNQYFINTYDNSSFQALVDFYLNEYNFFNDRIIERVLYKFKDYLSIEILNNFYDKFKEKNFELLLVIIKICSRINHKIDNKKVNELLPILEGKGNYNYSDLYMISSNKLRPKIKRIIYKQLNENFSLENYFKYVIQNIIKHDEYKETFLSYIKRIIELDYLDLNEAEQFFVNDYHLFNLISLILDKNLDTNYFSSIENKSKIVSFYLDRNNIDSEKFDIEFIRYFKNNRFIIFKILKYKAISNLVIDYLKNNKDDKEIFKLYLDYIL